MDAPQQTQKFVWLLSTSCHYLHMAFPGQDMELATQKQKEVAGMCQPQDQLEKAMGYFCGGTALQKRSFKSKPSI